MFQQCARQWLTDNWQWAEPKMSITLALEDWTVGQILPLPQTQVPRGHTACSPYALAAKGMRTGGIHKDYAMMTFESKSHCFHVYCSLHWSFCWLLASVIFWNRGGLKQIELLPLFFFYLPSSEIFLSMPGPENTRGWGAEFSSSFYPNKTVKGKTRF